MMRRIFFALSMLLMMVVSCTDPLSSETVSNAKLTVSPASMDFPRQGGEELITITTDAGSWSLTVDADWCVPARTSGRTSSTFKVKVNPNEGTGRTATLQVSAPGCSPFEIKVTQQGENQTMPSGVKQGINYNSDNSVTLVLYEADNTGKNYYDSCYLIGDFNDWEISEKYSMDRDDAAKCWWITLTGLDVDTEYAFQYCLRKDGANDVCVTDPYTEIVYDTGSDGSIPSTTYPGLKKLSHKANGLAAAFRINKPNGYSWKVNDFKVADKNDLVIYELHLRDFSATSDLNGALAQMDYLEELGVNVIQLMPIHEFEFNDSWGYNPTHFFAFDKAYGTRDKYKEFIDVCHQRGIAVFIDVVYNHATGLHPWAKMYWGGGSTVAEYNPWFNQYPTHPFNVHQDFNHGNPMVVEHVKESLQYLLTELKIDGFRFDLSKGFTQKKTDPDVNAWGRYDQDRVDLLKEYADAIWEVNPNAVVTLEHLSDWDEEKVLAEYGMQLWRNVNGEYRNAMLGAAGNFTNMYSTAPFGGFVGYMESHDEERICYNAVKDESASVSWGICGTITDWKTDITMSEDGPFFVAKGVEFEASDMFKIRGNKTWDDAYNYGASVKGYKIPLNMGYTLTLGAPSQDMAVPAAGTYDIYFSPDAGKIWLMTSGRRPLDSEVPVVEDENPLLVAMRRAGACAAFSLTVPGPKMIWQFGEIGYDISIEENGRTGRKPLKTAEYMAVPERKALYDTYSGLLRFRKENPRFFDEDAKFTWTPSATIKTIKCTVDGKSFCVIGNFAKGTQEVSVTLPSGGTWTNWFDGSETYTGTSVSFRLKAGEFKLLVN